MSQKLISKISISLRKKSPKSEKVANIGFLAPFPRGFFYFAKRLFCIDNEFRFWYGEFVFGEGTSK